MKRLLLFSITLPICLAVFYCAVGNSPQIHRGDLWLWRMALYGLACVVGGHLYVSWPQYRPTLRRIGLWFLLLVAANEIVPEVIR